MIFERSFTVLAFLLLCCTSGCSRSNRPAGEPALRNISLPRGFKIAMYADHVPNARSMALSPSGVLYVGTRGGGNVYAIIDSNKDSHADRVVTIASRLNMPNGVAFKDGSLYVAEMNRVIRFDSIETRLSRPPTPVVVNDSFPAEASHGWKFIRIGPDGKLYVPVGAPCNVCLSDDRRFATMMRMNLDGSNLEIYAEGIRNSVGFDWRPRTDELWFTDNGRDHLGDDVPPDELNVAARSGLHFGFPYVHGKSIADPEFNGQAGDRTLTPPAIELGPHVAALGMRFYTGSMFPAEYRNQVFIAEHGSWNRSNPIGYRISLVRFEAGRAMKYEVFAEGWLSSGHVSGRPVDLLVMPDGALLVSDDHAGAIYRISYME